MLRFLMEQNDLSQYDLADDLGGQPAVSCVLNKPSLEHVADAIMDAVGIRFDES